MTADLKVVEFVSNVSQKDTWLENAPILTKELATNVTKKDTQLKTVLVKIKKVKETVAKAARVSNAIKKVISLETVQMKVLVDPIKDKEVMMATQYRDNQKSK